VRPKFPSSSSRAPNFVELFVGAGAARVRDLSRQARKKPPCIILHDELDANRQIPFPASMAWSAGPTTTPSRPSTKTAHRDGWLASTGTNRVIVLAATNQPENAGCCACLRPGRFDRRCWFDRARSPGRQDDSRYLCQEGEALAEAVDLDSHRPGHQCFGGAPIWPTWVNEAALARARGMRLAGGAERSQLRRSERVVAGLEKRSRVPPRDDDKRCGGVPEVGSRHRWAPDARWQQGWPRSRSLPGHEPPSVTPLQLPQKTVLKSKDRP